MDERAYRAAERRLWTSLGVEPVERWLHLEHNDVDIRVQEIGEGPPVLFIHGASTSGASWASLVARFPGYRCIVLDRPGTGLSKPIPRRIDATSLGEIADTIVPDILDALELPSTNLVAASFGGYIALRAAAATPDRIDRMIHLSWPLGAPSGRLPISLRLMGLPGISRLMTSMPANRRSMRVLFRGLGHGPKLDDGRITAEDLDCFLALLRHTDTMRNEFAPARTLISPFRGLAQLYLTDETLSAVACPTLFVWGSRDPFGGEATARALVARIPGAQLRLIPDAGHTPWLDDMETVVRSVTAFLGREGSRSVAAA
jgi:2-hydroxy-6-oxonona-2,4-dienedioate hydrolase